MLEKEEEMNIPQETARLFADWVNEEMRSRGWVNDFLAADHQSLADDIAKINYDFAKMTGYEGSFEDFRKTSDAVTSLVQPTLKEVAEFAPQMRNIFDTIQERVEDGKTVLFSAEERNIIDKARKEDKLGLAPNGKQSNLYNRYGEHVWAMVRTPQFKNWFGDWERIEKVRNSDPIRITGKEITPSDDLDEYRKNARAYAMGKLRGEYTCKDTEEKILVNRNTVKETLRHDKTPVQFQSVAAIPQIIENGIYITTLPNEETEINRTVASYDYYVCGLKIGGEDYTVKAVIATKIDGKKYYDHALTKIEKGELISLLHSAILPGSGNNNPFSEVKDKRLISILQNNSSKVVDENGEPLVVYHGSRTGGEFNTFDGETFFIDNKDIADMFRDDASYFVSVNGKERNTRFGSNVRAIVGYLFRGDYEADELLGNGTMDIKEQWDSLNGNEKENIRDWLGMDEDEDMETLRIEAAQPTFETFLNIRNPYITDFNDRNWQADENRPEASFEKAREEGHDGMIIRNIVEGGLAAELLNGDEVPPATDYVTFSPNQIKSVDNIGDFSTENNDIRYSAEERAERAGRVLSEVRGQKRPGVFHDVSDTDLDDVRFSVGKGRRERMERVLDNSRPDLSREERDALYDYLGTLVKPDGKDDTKLQEAAFGWFCRGTVRLPEDIDKVRQAVKVAAKAKVDPMRYDSPMELMDSNSEFKVKDKPINPDEVPVLRKVREYPDGITVYEFDDGYDGYGDYDLPDDEEEKVREVRGWLRRIIDTHWGVDCNPWCLLQGDGKGNLTDDSRYYWGRYGRYGKRVAFKDGRLLAFFAAGQEDEPTWWDRQDRPHRGIPVTRTMDDGSGRTATYEYVEDMGAFDDNEGGYDIEEGSEDWELWHPMNEWRDNWKEGWSGPLEMRRGNKQNGTYEEWHKNGELELRANYKDGRLEGTLETYHDNGRLEYRQEYRDGERNGLFEKWHSNGDPAERGEYKDDRRNGLFEKWGETSDNYMRTNYVNGVKDGPYEFYKDGHIRERGEYKNDRKEGIWRLFWDTGHIQLENSLKGGDYDGASIGRDSRGLMTIYEEFKDGLRDGLRVRFWTPGKIEFGEEYKHGAMVRRLSRDEAAAALAERGIDINGEAKFSAEEREDTGNIGEKSVNLQPETKSNGRDTGTEVQRPSGGTIGLGGELQGEPQRGGAVGGGRGVLQGTRNKVSRSEPRNIRGDISGKMGLDKLVSRKSVKGGLSEGKEITDSQREEFSKQLKELTDKYDIPFVVLNTREELKAVARENDYPDFQNDEYLDENYVEGFVVNGEKPYLYAPGILEKATELDTDLEEAAKNVIFHEGVSHYGLQRMLGKHYDEFCDKVYKGMSYGDKARFISYVWDEGFDDDLRLEQLEEHGLKKDNSVGWGDLTHEERDNIITKTSKDLSELAAHEYIASIAEKVATGENLTNDETEFWSRFTDWVNRMFECEELTKEDIAEAVRLSSGLYSKDGGMEGTLEERESKAHGILEDTSTKYSVGERVAAADEARERLGVELTPDDRAIPSESCGGGR